MEAEKNLKEVVGLRERAEADGRVMQQQSVELERLEAALQAALDDKDRARQELHKALLEQEAVEQRVARDAEAGLQSELHLERQKRWHTPEAHLMVGFGGQDTSR